MQLTYQIMKIDTYFNEIFNTLEIRYQQIGRKQDEQFNADL